MTDAPVQTHWEPRVAALRDLILLTLSLQVGLTIRDDKGHVSAKIRELCGLPDSQTVRGQISNALKAMKAEGLVERDLNQRGKRTFSVTLVKMLTADELRKLAESREANLALFSTKPVTSTTTDEIERLVDDCTEALRVLQRIADQAERQTTSGRVAIAVKGALDSIGIRGERQREVRYYLRQLNLAKSIEPCDDARKLWWWEISRNKLNRKLLVDLATSSTRSYLAHCARPNRRNGGYIEDTARERRFAGDTPAVLPHSMCGPVTVRRIADESPADPPPVKEIPTDNDTGVDRLNALVQIIRTLEQQNEALQGELDERDRRIRELEELVRERGLTNENVEEILKRYPELH